MPDSALAGKPIEAGDNPFDWRLDRADFGNGAHYLLEVRPTAGQWKPFLAGVPAGERDKVVAILPGPSGTPPEQALVGNPKAGPTPDGKFHCWRYNNAATPTQSYFMYLKAPPAVVVFGQEDTGPQYQLPIAEIVGSSGA